MEIHFTGRHIIKTATYLDDDLNTSFEAIGKMSHTISLYLETYLVLLGTSVTAIFSKTQLMTLS